MKKYLQENLAAQMYLAMLLIYLIALIYICTTSK